jgi:hypothetical protein
MQDAMEQREVAPGAFIDVEGDFDSTIKGKKMVCPAQLPFIVCG